MLEYEWDVEKNKLNIEKHGISLAMGKLMYLSAAIVIPDERKDYGEVRYSAVGPIMGRLYVMIFTERHGKLRIISLRKANRREVTLYEKTTR